ncbi:MAG: PPC domain-containing protein, partial [Fimbriimonadales bacterium]
MRKVLALAGTGAILACAWAQISMTPYREQEPNNSFSASQIIEAPVNLSKGFVVWDAQLNPVQDRDFYRFQVTQAGTYSLRVDTNLDACLRLYDANGNLIAENDNDGNPDLPLNRFTPGLTRNLTAGIYFAEVYYWQNLGQARYALRVFPGTAAPDYDPSEPNNTPERAVYLGRLAGGELITNQYCFLSYDGGDVDVYRFELDNTGQILTIRTQTYVDTVLRVVAPGGQVYENDDAEWDTLNPTASQVEIPLAPRGTYYVYVRANPRWGGYYQLRVSAPLPDEIVLQDDGTEFRLRGLRGERTRVPFNNADWLLNGRDHCYQMGWWYRIQDLHNREYTLSNLTYYA